MGWKLYSYPQEQYLGDATDYRYSQAEPEKIDADTLEDRNAEPIDGVQTDTIEFTAPAVMPPGDYLLVLVDEHTGQRQRIFVQTVYEPGDWVLAKPGPKA